MPGAFDVQIHYNGTLFAQGTEIEAMQRGNLEVALTSPQDIAALIPEYSIFTTGYLMRDPAHLDAVYDGDIGKEYKAQGRGRLDLHIVRSQYLGTRHVILREPREVKTPADMKGLKLRMPGSEAWQFLGNALGANATPLAFEEVYLAHADRHDRRAGEPAARRHLGQVLRGLQAGRADRPPGGQHLLHLRQALLGRPHATRRRRRSSRPRPRPRSSTTRA